MDSYTAWAAVGGAAGLIAVWLVKLEARRRAEAAAQYEAQAWAVFLVIAALIYVGFALFNGAGLEWIGIELGGLVAYSLLAFVGVKRWPLLIGPAWLAHALWDQFVHPGGHPGFVPAWYVPACLGFDIVVGVMLMATLRYQPKGNFGGLLRRVKKISG